MTSWKTTFLHTPLGKRTLYDSVCYCNRCGMCANVCPSYRKTHQEPFSPRGRNQAIRLILEGKLTTKTCKQKLEEIVTSCSLCGQCTFACPGQIPTAQHVIELRRALNLPLLPRTLVVLFRVRYNKPALFKQIFNIARWINFLPFISLAAYIPGFSWIRHAKELVPGPLPKPFQVPFETKPSLIYLPSLEAQFLLPSLAQQTWQLAQQKHRTQVWQNMASGLFEYVYGDVRRSRLQVRKLIDRHARLCKGDLPLLTDSAEVYSFLRNAPQLFEENSLWQKKAIHFAQHIRFITDLLPKKLPASTSFASPVQVISCIDKDLLQSTHAILRTLFKKNFVKCEYTDASVPLLGYGFVKHNLALPYGLQAVQAIALHQTQTVFVLSGLTALELEFYLRTFYPTAHAYHLIALNG